MSLAEFITILTNSVYLLLGFLSILNYLTHRDTIHLSIAFLFGSMGVIVILGAINRLLPERSRLLGLIAQLLLIAHPYLLLRLVKLFRPVTRWIEAVAQGCLFLSWAAVIFIPDPLPGAVGAIIALQMVIFEIYGTYAFLHGAVTTRGVTRWRMSLAAVGSASLGAFLFLAGLSSLFHGLRYGFQISAQILAITSGISYYLSFATPRWLRHALQNTELYYFLRESSKFSLENRAAEILPILRLAAIKAVGGRAALVIQADDARAELLLRSTGEFKVFSLKDTQLGQQSIYEQISHYRQPLLLYDLNIQEAQLAETYGADTLYLVPISATEQMWGLLLVFAYGKPIFAEDELSLLSLFAEQSAIVLDYAALLSQRDAYAEQLKQSHAETIRQNEQQLRLITNSIPALIAYLNKEQRYQFVNRTYQDWLDLSSENLIGRSTREVFGEEYYLTIKDYVAKALSGEHVAYENYIFDKDGKKRFINISYTPDFDDNRQIRGYFMMATDITGRKESEEALQRYSQRLHFLNVASRMLTETTTDYQRMLDMIVRQAAEHLQEACLIRLLSSDGQYLEPVAYYNIQPELSPTIADVVFKRSLPIEGPLTGETFKKGVPLLLTQKDMAAFSQQIPDEYKNLVEKINLKTMIIVPLRVEGRSIGQIYFSRQSEILPDYTQEDLLLASNLADRVALAIRNAQLLREKEETLALLDTLFYSAPVGLAFFDRDLRFKRINQALADINGLSIQDHLGNTPYELLPQVETKGTQEMFLQVLETGQSVHFETEGYTPADSTQKHYWLASYYPVKLQNEILGLGAVVMDITERRQMEESLRNSEQHLRNVLDSLFAYVGVMTPDGILIEANKTALQSASLDQDDVLGKPFEDAYWWSYDTEIQSQLRQTIYKAAQGEFSRYDVKIRLAEEHFVEIDFMIAPMFDENGSVVYLIPSGIDITERRKAEEELKHTARQLEISNIELQNFAYIASHDLQEPLRKVQAFGDRLKIKYANRLDDEGLDYLERMQKAAKRMQTLIQDLLVYSRLSQKRPFVTVNLNQAVRSVLEDLEIRIRDTQGEIRIDNLPTIEADPVQIHQLFLNLLSNALKYHKVGIAPQIHISCELLPGKKAKLCVADNGIGFDTDKYLDKIFGFFQRLHGRNDYEGTGMGLAICKRIVEQHDGDITATSREGEGTTFIVTLPLKQRKGKNAVQIQ